MTIGERIREKIRQKGISQNQLARMDGISQSGLSTIISGASGEMVTVTAWKSVYASYVNAMETAINGVSRRWWGNTSGSSRKAANCPNGCRLRWFPTICAIPSALGAVITTLS